MGKKIKYDNLFEKIVSVENIEKAYNKSRKGDSKYDLEAMIFSLDVVTNINNLIEELITGEYKFGGYFEFEVYEPKKE